MDNDPANDVNVGEDDGKIDPYGAELLQWPGQEYPEPQKETFEAFNGPTSNNNFYTDKWGKTITGYAPIKDSQGKAVAVIAVDVDGQTFEKINSSAFSFLPYFLGSFLLFVLIRLSAFNLSL
jgi:methyl-accepting chemotaxis protein